MAHKPDIDHRYWDMQHSGLHIGVSLFAFQAVSSIVSVRRTSRAIKKFKIRTRITFTVAALFYILFGISFHLFYGTGVQEKIAFDYFKHSKILYNLRFVPALNPFFSIPMSIIVIMETFEKMKSSAKYLKDSSG